MLDSSGNKRTIERTIAEANDAIALRCDLINGSFQLGDDTIAFMKFTRVVLDDAAHKLGSYNADVPMDHDRFVAGMDLLQQAKDVLCAAAILGAEAKTRAAAKKAKTN